MQCGHKKAEFVLLPLGRVLQLVTQPASSLSCDYDDRACSQIWNSAEDRWIPISQSIWERPTKRGAAFFILYIPTRGASSCWTPLGGSTP